MNEMSKSCLDYGRVNRRKVREKIKSLKGLHTGSIKQEKQCV